MGQALTLETHDAVLVVRWNRQAVRNALDPQTIIDIAAALDGAASSGAARAAVLTGTGEVAFSAGMDLKALAADRALAGQAYAAWMACLASPDRLPLVAAVNGMAMGGGFEIAMRCDLVVAAEHAEFGLPEVTQGIVPHGGALDFPAIMPMHTALELALLGERVSAARLHALGLVNRVVPAAEVVPTAVALARRLASFDPATVRQIRHGLWAT